MTSHSSRILCTAVYFVVAAIVGAAEEKPAPLALKLSAHMSSARSHVVVRARVEPDARSRELTIEWVADDLSGGSHAITLEGERAAATHHYTLKDLSPGQYAVTAILRLNDGTEVRRKSNLWVVGVGGPDAFGASAAQGALGGNVRPASQP
jgi:hypothetical protein